MTKNTLGDLQNHLFVALERVNDEELTGEKLDQEMTRAKVVASVAAQIISNANLVLKVKVAQEEFLRDSEKPIPSMLEG